MLQLHRAALPIGQIMCSLTIAWGMLQPIFAAEETTRTKQCLALYKVISARQATALRELAPTSSTFIRRMHDLENELFVALQSCHQHPLLFTLMTENQIALQNIQLAQLYASKAHQQRPDLWQTNHALGTVLMMQENYVRGVAYLEKAVELSPDRPALQLNLCSGYVVAARYQEAVQTCSRLLDNTGHQLHGPAYYQRSLANRALGNDTKAAADLARAQAISPQLQ